MDKANAEKFFAHVGDLVGEANEADGKFLYVSSFSGFQYRIFSSDGWNQLYCGC